MAYAQLETRHADLATDFGLDWATKLFGTEAIASLPVRASGKNKGKPKGFVIWRKATIAGYCRDVQAPLAVGQLADAWIGSACFSGRSNAVQGQWMGRSQSLAAAASAGCFFDAGRARHAAEQARNEADRQEMIADWKAQQAGQAT
jgi:hypothetical protein